MLKRSQKTKSSKYIYDNDQSNVHNLKVRIIMDVEDEYLEMKRE